MAPLNLDQIDHVYHSALDGGLASRRAALLSDLPRSIQAQLPTAPAECDQLRLDLNELNRMVAEDGTTYLGLWLRAAVSLTKGLRIAEELSVALALLDEAATIEAPSGDHRVEQEMLADRVRCFYEQHGYRVYSDHHRSLPVFLIWDQDATGRSHLGVIGVAAHPIDQVLAVTAGRVKSLRQSQPWARGHVILTSPAPESVEKVRSAGLEPIVYSDLWRDVFQADRLVRKELASVESDARYQRARFVDQALISEARGDAASALAATEEFLADDEARMLLVLGDYGLGKSFLLRRVFADSARRFFADPGAPAPVLVTLSRSVRPTLHDLVGSAFNRHYVRYNSAALLPLLEDGTLLLLFDGFDEMSSRISRAALAENAGVIRQAVRGRSKVIVTCRAQLFASSTEIARELGLSAPGSRKIELARFDDHRVALFFGGPGGGESSGAGARVPEAFEELRKIPALFDLAHRPVFAGFIANDLGRVLKLARGDQDITSARLVESYVREELRRSELDRGVLPIEDKIEALRRLALRLWSVGGSTLSWGDVTDEVRSRMPQAGKDDVEAAGRELLRAAFLSRAGAGGPGNTDDRSEWGEVEDRCFSHQAIFDFFLADAVAGGVSAETTGILESRVLPGEAATFLVERLGKEAARELCSRLRSQATTAARENAALLSSRARGPRAPGRPAEPLMLAGADLTMGDLSSLDFRDAELSDASLSGARLRGRDLSGATLVRADLRGADLTDADLRGADLAGARLDGACLIRARLDGANLEGASLDGARTFRAARDGGLLQPEALLCEGGPCGAPIPLLDPDRVTCLRWAGGTILAGHAGGSVRVWDAETSKLLATFSGPHGRVLALAPGPHAPLALVARTGGGLACGAVGAAEAWLPESEVCAAAWSPDRKLVAAALRDCRLTVLDALGKEVLAAALPARPACAAFGRKDRIACGLEDGTLRVYSSKTGKETAALRQEGQDVGHAGGVRAVAYSPDGNVIASAGADRMVRLWDPRGGLLAALSGAQGAIDTLAFSADGKLLAAGGGDRSLRIWDVGSHELRAVLLEQPDSVSAAVFSPADAKVVAVSCSRAGVGIWDVARDRQRASLGVDPPAALVLAGDPGGRAWVASDVDGVVRVFDPRSGALVRSIGQGGARVFAMLLDRDGDTLSAGLSDGSVRRWSVATGVALGSFRAHDRRVRAMAVSPRDDRLITGSDDRTVRFWSSSGKPAGETERLQHAVHALAAGRTGLLAAGTADGRVHVLDLRAGKRLRDFAAHERAVSHLAFAPDGVTLATSSEEPRIRVWDARKGKLVVELSGHRKQVAQVAFSPDGAMLASASQDGTVRVWDVANGALHRTLEGHVHGVTCVMWLGGTALLSASRDGTLRAWSIGRRGPAATLFAGPAGEWVTFTPDGHFIGSPRCGSIYGLADGLTRYEVEDVEDVFRSPERVAEALRGAPR